MTVKLNPTSWLTENLVGVCYCVYKTHLHTPICGYIPVGEIEKSSQVSHKRLKVQPTRLRS